MDKYLDSIITGLMLGDGTIDRRKPTLNGYLRVRRAYSDVDYNLKLAEVMGPMISTVRSARVFDKRTLKTYEQSILTTRCLPYISKVHERWYVDKIKIVPKDLILDDVAVATWFADDGSVIRNKRGTLVVKFATHSFTYEENVFLSGLLNQMYGEGFIVQKYKVKGELRGHYITCNTKRTCNNLFRSIDPHILLQRKASIWRKTDYTTEIIHPNCDVCGGRISKNGKSKVGLQRLYCPTCKKYKYNCELIENRYYNVRVIR